MCNSSSPQEPDGPCCALQLCRPILQEENCRAGEFSNIQGSDLTGRLQSLSHLPAQENWLRLCRQNCTESQRVTMYPPPVRTEHLAQWGHTEGTLAVSGKVTEVTVCTGGLPGNQACNKYLSLSLLFLTSISLLSAWTYTLPSVECQREREPSQTMAPLTWD